MTKIRTYCSNRRCHNHYADWAYADVLLFVFAKYPYEEYEKQLKERIRVLQWNQRYGVEIDSNHYRWQLRIYKRALADLHREDERACDYCEKRVPESQLKMFHEEIIPHRTDLFYWCGECDLSVSAK